MRDPKKFFRALLVGFLVWIFGAFFSLKTGSVTDANLEIIRELRLPRLLLGTAVGAGLAISGAVLQALFSNPLCEPYTLGISSGAALGTVLGGFLGFQWFFAGLAGSSLAGALIFAGALDLISRHSENGTKLLLSGVMLGFLGSSLVALVMALSDANGIQGAVYWLLGDLSRARLEGGIYSLIGVSLLFFLLWARAQDLDALLMGEEGALSLGVPAPNVRRKMVLLVSLLVALCVSSSGMIGFVGLMVPHFVRRLTGSLHRTLLPLSAVWGSATLVIADTLARNLARPYELPVGVVTALVGAPVFIWMMLRPVSASRSLS